MTDAGCDRAGEAAAWVLGTLSPEGADRYAAHLEGCATCRSEVAGLQRAADAMAASAVPERPPARLLGRLPHRPRRRRARVGAPVAAALLLVGLGVGLGRLIPDDEPAAQPGAETRSYRGEVLARNTRDGTAIVEVRGRDARLVVTGVDPPPAGRVYQAWLERDGGPPVSTGALFSIGDSRTATVALPDIVDVERVIVTTERPRGSRAPSPPLVAAVRLPTGPDGPGRADGPER